MVFLDQNALQAEKLNAMHWWCWHVSRHGS